MHTVPEEDSTIFTQVCSILQTPKPTVTTNVVNVRRQEGGTDCGLFTIAMAFDLCAGVDPVTKEYAQIEISTHASTTNYLSHFQAHYAALRRENSLKSQLKSTANVECLKNGSGCFVVISAMSGIMRGVFQFQLRYAMMNGIKFLGNALSAKKVHTCTIFTVSSSKFENFECCIPIFKR